MSQRWHLRQANCSNHAVERAALEEGAASVIWSRLSTPVTKNRVEAQALQITHSAADTSSHSQICPRLSERACWNHFDAETSSSHM